MKARLAQLGTDPATNSAEEFDQMIVAEVANFIRIARAANIIVD